MDGMSKNPSHSSRVTHPCAPVIQSAVVQNANDSKLEFRPALTSHRSPRDWTQHHSPECVSKLGTASWNVQTIGEPGLQRGINRSARLSKPTPQALPYRPQAPSASAEP